MAIDYERLIGLNIPDVQFTYTARDTILYALGLGCGDQPTEMDELRFVYEKDLQAIPTMACVLAHPGFWMRDLDTGIDWLRVVHGEQDVRIHRPLPVSGTVIGRTRVTEVVDKGAGKDALLFSQRTIHDKTSGDLFATVDQLYVCRGAGGFGGTATVAPRAVPEMDDVPTMTVILPTAPQLALIYRLSGDWNPIHVDPAIARKAGFERPILHGLCTFGIAARALIRGLCGYQADRLRQIAARFSSPVLPADTIRFDIWLSGGYAAFRATAIERNVVVLQNGTAEIAPG